MSPEEYSPFDSRSDAGMVWMRNAGGVPAAFPAASASAWQAMGWEPCDPPADVDPALAERPDLQAVLATPVAPSDPEPVPTADAGAPFTSSDETEE